MPIEYRATANRLGLTMDDIDQLLEGRGTIGTASRLGITIADIQNFVRGVDVSADVCARLRLQPPAAADDLARKIGRQGRIGLLFGLLFS